MIASLLVPLGNTISSIDIMRIVSSCEAGTGRSRSAGGRSARCCRATAHIVDNQEWSYLTLVFTPTAALDVQYARATGIDEIRQHLETFGPWRSHHTLNTFTKYIGAGAEISAWESVPGRRGDRYDDQRGLRRRAHDHARRLADPFAPNQPAQPPRPGTRWLGLAK